MMEEVNGIGAGFRERGVTELPLLARRAASERSSDDSCGRAEKNPGELRTTEA